MRVCLLETAKLLSGIQFSAASTASHTFTRETPDVFAEFKVPFSSLADYTRIKCFAAGTQVGPASEIGKFRLAHRELRRFNPLQFFEVQVSDVARGSIHPRKSTTCITLS